MLLLLVFQQDTQLSTALMMLGTSISYPLAVIILIKIGRKMTEYGADFFNKYRKILNDPGVEESKLNEVPAGRPPVGGRGSTVSNVRNDDGTMTSSSQITGNTKNSGAMGTATTNRAGQTIEKQTPRFMGIQQTTNIDPNTEKETTSTNYRGKVDGVDLNVTAPGTFDKFDINKATDTQVSSGGVTVGNNVNTGRSASITGPSGNNITMNNQGIPGMPKTPVAPVAPNAPIKPVPPMKRVESANESYGTGFFRDILDTLTLTEAGDWAASTSTAGDRGNINTRLQDYQKREAERQSRVNAVNQDGAMSDAEEAAFERMTPKQKLAYKNAYAQKMGYTDSTDLETQYSDNHAGSMRINPKFDAIMQRDGAIDTSRITKQGEFVHNNPGQQFDGDAAERLLKTRAFVDPNITNPAKMTQRGLQAYHTIDEPGNPNVSLADKIRAQTSYVDRDGNDSNIPVGQAPEANPQDMASAEREFDADYAKEEVEVDAERRGPYTAGKFGDEDIKDAERDVYKALTDDVPQHIIDKQFRDRRDRAAGRQSTDDVPQHIIDKQFRDRRDRAAGTADVLPAAAQQAIDKQFRDSRDRAAGRQEALPDAAQQAIDRQLDRRDRATGRSK
jgi:hypothetical protein